MIVVTGAAGFIGSCLVNKLNNKGFDKLILVDDFSKSQKDRNLQNKAYLLKIDRMDFFLWLRDNFKEVSFIYHIGARTDTTEFDSLVFDELNLNYSKKVWNLCVKYNIPLVYASSAATYGMGDMGYDDDEALVDSLKPLNPYGESKNEFDKWVLHQAERPPVWAGLKFFNVYGPNEFHKGRMASVIFHAFLQIKSNGEVALFRSHNPAYDDGKQLRDFIYVKDVVNICFYFMTDRKFPGIYNVGTGKARTFIDLARATFSAMGLKENIRFIDTPEDIRDKYQYFTEAKMAKLISAGYNFPFYSLEQGINDYVKSYLMSNMYY
jgi:ADP-L-glycero-D-manno-heptose 6-epimerase